MQTSSATIQKTFHKIKLPPLQKKLRQIFKKNKKIKKTKKTYDEDAIFFV